MVEDMHFHINETTLLASIFLYSKRIKKNQYQGEFLTVGDDSIGLLSDSVRQESDIVSPQLAIITRPSG